MVQADNTLWKVSGSDLVCIPFTKPLRPWSRLWPCADHNLGTTLRMGLITIIPILRMRKLRLSDGQQFAYCRTAKGQRARPPTGSLSPEPAPLHPCMGRRGGGRGDWKATPC